MTIAYYNENTDDFLISCRDSEEKVKKNFLLDDFVISVTASGKIVGLEIKNISKFLIDMGVNPSILKKFENAELQIIPKKNFIGISLSFAIPEKENLIERRIPITHIPVEVTC